MVRRTVWVLNLDAEEELGARGAYRPSRRMQAVLGEHAAAARGLLAPGDLTVDELETPRAAGSAGDELRGRAWCPTPSALARLAAAGVAAESAPGVEVLRRVVQRGFGAALGQHLPGATWAADEAGACAAILDAPAGRPLLVKRAFGAAGRGRRLVHGGALDEADRAWLRAALRRGGVQVEPRVEIVTELALHGELAPDGALRLGVLCEQRCSASGTWLTSRVAEPSALAPSECAALEAEARAAAGALHAAGYFGPFGLDAYRWRDADGELRFNPRGELNARYTMGWAIGMRAAASRETRSRGGRGGGTRTRDS